MNDKIKKSIIYNSVGSFIYLFCQWIITFIVVWIAGYELAGILALAMSISTTFNVISSFSMRNFQSSDISNRFSEKTYIVSRIISCSIAFIVTILYCIIHRYSLYSACAVLIFMLYKISDAVVDVFHGSLQRLWKFDVIGFSFFVRGLILVIFFSLTLFLTNNIVLSLLMMTIFEYLFVYFYDYKKYRQSFKKLGQFNKIDLISLYIQCLPLVICGILLNYIAMYPRVTLESLYDSTILGYYATVATPAVIIQVSASFIYNPLISLFAENYKKKDHNFEKHVVFITIIILVLGIIGYLVSSIFADKFLFIIYGEEIVQYSYLFKWVVIVSTLCALYWFYNMLLVIMRKQSQILLGSTIGLIFILLFTRYAIENYYMNGINAILIISYILISAISLVFVFINLHKNYNPKKKIIAVRLMGGLGNQMFQYATLRNLMIKYDMEGIIDLSGITNLTHNVYSLEHLNISDEVKVINNFKSTKKFFAHLTLGIYYHFLEKRKYGFNLLSEMEKQLNELGIYCAPDGYIKLEKPVKRINYLEGYFQSSKYFDDNKKIIRNELKVIDKPNKRNKRLIDEISKNNSVCLHIRRGDYIGGSFQVCTDKYYYKAIKYINTKIKNPVYYIFSDDIDWVSKNMKFDGNVVFVNNNNSNFEELQVMYNCKHFIISNSTFSYWAQFLADNKNKIVVAPSIWFKDGKKTDIYEKEWTLIDVE